MILHCADRALYSAKRNGRGEYSFYDETMKDMFSEISPIDEERRWEERIREGWGCEKME